MKSDTLTANQDINDSNQAKSSNDFLMYVINGDLNAIKDYANQGGSFAVENQKALWLACEHGHLEILCYLMDSKIHGKNAIRPQNKHEVNSIFYIPTKHGHLNIVDFFLCQNEIQNGVKCEIFNLACLHNKYEIAQYILDNEMISIDRGTFMMLQSKSYYPSEKHYLNTMAFFKSQNLHEKLEYQFVNEEMLEHFQMNNLEDESIFFNMIKKGADIHYKNDRLLEFCLEVGDMNLLKFILNSPLINDHITPDGNEQALKMAELYLHPQGIELMCLHAQNPVEYKKLVTECLSNNFQKLISSSISLLDKRILRDHLNENIVTVGTSITKKI